MNPFESEWVDGKWWNFKTKELTDVDTSKCGQLVDFDEKIQEYRGYNSAQVFRNHRLLRLLGHLKDGVYKHTGAGQSSAA